MSSNQINRREFMRRGAGTAALGAAANVTLLSPGAYGATSRTAPADDRIRFASIGTGVRGCEILRAAISCPGTEMVATCDLYDGRLKAAQEFARKELFATKDYRAILDRKDVDAVLIATPDHWHTRLVEDSTAAGKDVYCEKPMTHMVEEGFRIIDAVKKTSRILQVGSQRCSSIVYMKAKEIFDSGYLGQVTAVESSIDRNDASGAWVYPIPPDASEQTIDWNAFLGSAPKRPFDPKRFFRWRCYQDYSEGLPGDLYVHILTGIHFITGITAPPLRAAAMGGLFRWTDDRDVPDLVWTLYEYPNFRASIRCNLNNESPEYTRIFGTKGTLEIKNDVLTVTPQAIEPQPEGYSIYGWPEKLRADYLKDWAAEHPQPAPGHYAVAEQGQIFQAPAAYDYERDHMNYFMESVRTRKTPVEDATFGNNTAIACHMANYSYFNKTIAVWDSTTRRIKS